MTNSENNPKLTKLALSNFRNLQSLDLDLAPITLLTGPNSSGKSSVLSSIASILQTRGSNLFPFEFIPNGENCSLGGFKDIVHGGSTRSRFGIKLQIEKSTTTAILSGSYRYSPNGDHILPAEMGLTVLSDESTKHFLDIVWDKQNQHYRARYSSSKLLSENYISTIIGVIQATSKVFASSSDSKTVKNKSNSKNDELDIEKVKETFLDAQKNLNKWQKLKSTNPQELRSEISAILGANDLLKDLQAVNRDLWRHFSYVGPVRAYPERYYALVDRGNQIDPTGELATLVLANWKNSKPKQFTEVTELLSKLSLAEGIIPDSQGEDILKLKIRPKGHKKYVNYADTGFGISQVLPILIKDVALNEFGTLIINQPEVHLHPSAQAQLANYFAGRIAKRRFIIETHSEYLVNRLRLLVADGHLDPDKVAIYYFDAGKDGKTKKHKISILGNGNLEGAPPSYFETYSSDAMKIVSAGFN